ncbi:MAG TPA: BTAD domain-containing putative transcriptional regulator [Streptosporangiaceae bacterium]|nr:BTAD domain-containing putative transcriptional regulator [Streptosporangiaceae bacterium]
MRVEVLGAVRAWRQEQELTLGHPRQRALLAMLAVHADRPVGRDELIDGIWGSAPPVTAANCVHSYVARLRLVLEPGRPAHTPSRILVSSGPGYALRLDAGQVDASVFAGHLLRARQLRAHGDLAGGALSLDAALALWHGTPLAGIPGPFAEAERVRLFEEYLTAAEDRAEFRLATGGQEQVAGQLAQLVREHPFRERLAALYMLALFRGGRQAEALAAYQRTRQILVDELGLEPGQELRRIHEDILQGRDSDMARGPCAAAPARAAAVPVTPHQLPPAIPHFTGRQAELQSLADLAATADATAGWPVISVISGTAGVGKTALAVRHAHNVAELFPDGQLYVNLHGFDPAGPPAPPSAAIRDFLRAMAVPSRRIPSQLNQQAALYRSVLAGRRMLVVLDNAQDEEQVRPLLPGGPGCMVVVTSRSQLTGLAVANGAHQLGLRLFSRGEGSELLARRLGCQRVAADAEAADELVALCARLPLALSVAAARAAAMPMVSLAALAEELRQTRSRLDALDTGDGASSIRAAFARSYQDLSRPAARMFRLLGLHPGPDIAVPAAASIAGCPADQARAALAELARLNLVIEHAHGRFTCHDLLRAYAAEQADALDAEPERRAAIRRMLDHYLHSARRGAVLLHPARDEVTPSPPLAGVVPERLTDHRQALAWYDTEHAVLLAAAELAAGAGFDVHAWQLPWALVPFLYRRGHWHDWIALEAGALAAADRLGDQNARARALLDLGYAHAVRARPDEADPPLRQALRLFRQLGDQVGQARVHNALAMALESQRRHAEALRYAKRSLRLYEAAGNAAAQANALTTVGWYHALLGDHQQALARNEQAIAVHRRLGNRHGEAAACMVVGHALHNLGRHAEAIASHQRSLKLFRDLGDLQHQADALIQLGDAQQAAGNPQAAREAWQHALAILERLHHPDVTPFRARLARVS